jgi:hypothetical protein
VARITFFSRSHGGSQLARAEFSKQPTSRHTVSRSYRKLRFEPLEDRRLLTTLTVTNLTDATVTGPGSAPGTFRQAIYDANISSDADIIEFAPGLAGDLRLSIADDSAIGLSAMLITSPITIQGNAAGVTIKRDITAPEMRFFRVALGGDLTLNSINLTGGISRGSNGAVGQDGGSAFGGAVYNQGNLQIIASALYSNVVIGGNAGSGGTSGAGQGGGVFNDGGNLAIRNSTLSTNSASNGFGSIVARSYGGGVSSRNGLLTIDDSTITNGTAASGRDVFVIGVGAGHTATAQIRSSIIAQADVQLLAFDFNATDDLDGQVVVTGSNNLIRYQNSYQSITVSTDDPLLGTLANNGGPTLTHALSTNSPAINLGVNPLGLVNDQRGTTYARVVGSSADIGAFELQTVATPELPGDYNGSHVVDAADYVLWRKSLGAQVSQYSGADGNGSSKIDDADYSVWRTNFGAPASASSATVTTQTNLVTKVVQPELPRAKTTDTAIAGTLAQQFSRSLENSDGPTHKRPCEDRMSSAIAHQARNEALLAIIAGHPERRISNDTLESINGDFEPHAARPRSYHIAVTRDDAFRAGERIIDCKLPDLSGQG